jgi:pimeloyl-ACP methyl ester carboxylesterase
LKNLGYGVEMFNYPLFPKKEDITEKLLEKVVTFKPTAIIGHSLGGVIAVHNIARLDKNVKRIVCLGSPLSGSLLAKETIRYSSSFFISKPAQELLLQGVSIPPTSIEVGVIAGTNSSFGFNMVYRVLGGYHDGTVAVEETKIPGTKEHMEIRVGHTGLIFSEKVMTHAASFIKKGSFV